MKTGWINIYKPMLGSTLMSYETSGQIFNTKEEALEFVDIDDIIDTIQISFNENTGISSER